MALWAGDTGNMKDLEKASGEQESSVILPFPGLDLYTKKTIYELRFCLLGRQIPRLQNYREFQRWMLSLSVTEAQEKVREYHSDPLEWFTAQGNEAEQQEYERRYQEKKRQRLRISP